MKKSHGIWIAMLATAFIIYGGASAFAQPSVGSGDNSTSPGGVSPNEDKGGGKSNCAPGASDPLLQREQSKGDLGNGNGSSSGSHQGAMSGSSSSGSSSNSLGSGSSPGSAQGGSQADKGGAGANDPCPPSSTDRGASGGGTSGRSPSSGSNSSTSDSMSK